MKDKVQTKDESLLSALELIEAKIAAERKARYQAGFQELILASLYRELIASIRQHPDFSDIQGYQVSEKEIRLPTGKKVSVHARSIKLKEIFSEAHKTEILARVSRQNQ